jgi:hypothetical protein
VWNRLHKHQPPTSATHSGTIAQYFFKTSVRAKLSPGFSGFAIQRHTRSTADQNDVYRSHGRGGEKACLSGDLCEYGRPEIKVGAGCVCPTNSDGCGTLPLRIVPVLTHTFGDLGVVIALKIAGCKVAQ